DGQDRSRAAKAGAKQLPAAPAHQRPGGATRSGRGVRSGGRMSETREERRNRLVDVYHEASECTKCPLSETRTNVVFGAGNSDASLMFVGEPPGAEEDRQGRPFVGRAGALLTELLAGLRLHRT